MFSCEYCEIFKKTYFEEHLRINASPLGNRNLIYKWCLLRLPDNITLRETFDGIYSGKFLCVREMQFELSVELYVQNQFLHVI